MSAFSEQTRVNLEKHLHDADYKVLLGLLFEGQTTKFVCLKPDCSSNADREAECRKAMILRSVLTRVNSLVSGGMELEEAIDSIEDYCGCDLPACACYDDTTFLSGGGSGR